MARLRILGVAVSARAGGRKPKAEADHADGAAIQLYLHDAAELMDLRTPPGNRLEAKKGKLAGYYAIRINDQWRILFRWEGGNAKDVQVTDYH